MSKPTPLEAALRGRCPRCARGKMFDGWIAFAPYCNECRFDFSRYNVGDGPVVFLTLGIGALVTVMAVWVELAYSPGYFVHAVLWVPVTAILVVAGLRFAKGLLLALEYKNRASEGKLKK